MPWVGIADSGLDYAFSQTTGGAATMDGSVITAEAISGTFGIGQGLGAGPVQFRLTISNYQSGGFFGEAPSFISCFTGSGTVFIDNGNDSVTADSFIPNPVEFTGIGFDYSPGLGSETTRQDSLTMLVEVFVEAPPETSYNCECDDDYPRTTLGDMRKRLLRRLGFAAQANNPPPGMADLLDDFIQQAQEMLFRRYSVFRRERWFTWDLIPGTRFYDLDANADECTKRLEPRMITWAGISQGDDSWRPLVCGIDPVMYSSRGPGIPSHYEIRQCIELWPAPSDATWKLRIKGQFGLLPLVAATDSTSIDPEAIFLLALANAKAHYGQPDAGNYASQLQAYVRDLVRGSHMTRRYLPGTSDPRNAVRPIPVGGWPESTP